MTKCYFDEQSGTIKGDSLYFVATEITGHIKIGRAINVPRRLKNIGSGNHEPISLLGTIRDAGWQEHVWHEMFSDLRVNGEWFAPSSRLNRAINLALQGKRWSSAFRGDDWELCDNLLSIAEDLTIGGVGERKSVRSYLASYAAEFDDTAANYAPRGKQEWSV